VITKQTTLERSFETLGSFIRQRLSNFILIRRLFSSSLFSVRGDSQNSHRNIKFYHISIFCKQKKRLFAYFQMKQLNRESNALRKGIAKLCFRVMLSIGIFLNKQATWLHDLFGLLVS